MIKINLLGKKAKLKVPTVLGIDLSKLSIIGWVLAIVIYFVPEMFIVPMFKQEVAEINIKIKAITKKAKKKKRELREERKTEAAIDLYDKRIALLKRRGEQVQEIINRRTNPMKLLLHLARSVPEDLWIDSVDIKNSQIEIHGGASKYSSIGSFMNSSNSSIYFNRSLTLPDYSTREVKGTGRKSIREEVFTIKGRINRFE